MELQCCVPSVLWAKSKQWPDVQWMSVMECSYPHLPFRTELLLHPASNIQWRVLPRTPDPAWVHDRTTLPISSRFQRAKLMEGAGTGELWPPQLEEMEVGPISPLPDPGSEQLEGPWPCLGALAHPLPCGPPTPSLPGFEKRLLGTFPFSFWRRVCSQSPRSVLWASELICTFFPPCNFNLNSSPSGLFPLVGCQVVWRLHKHSSSLESQGIRVYTREGGRRWLPREFGWVGALQQMPSDRWLARMDWEKGNIWITGPVAPLFEEYDVVCMCKHPQSIFEVLGVKREEVHRDGLRWWELAPSFC